MLRYKYVGFIYILRELDFYGFLESRFICLGFVIVK